MIKIEDSYNDGIHWKISIAKMVTEVLLRLPLYVILFEFLADAGDTPKENVEQHCK